MFYDNIFMAFVPYKSDSSGISYNVCYNSVVDILALMVRIIRR